MIRASLLALPLLALAVPAMAQEHDHSAHQAQPAPAPTPTPSPTPTEHDHSAHQAQPTSPPTPAPTPAEHDHSQMGHGAMDHGAMNHGAMGHGAMDHTHMDHAAMGHAMPAPASTAPPPQATQGPVHAADAIWGEAAMARARTLMVREMGGQMTTAVFYADRLEARLGGEDGYAWDVEALYGNATDALVLKSEGEGDLDGGDVEHADVQAMWGHAITPWFDLQAGVKLDIEPDTRLHAALGVEGLLPYMIHLEAAAFLSDQGDLTADVEATHDMRLTQRLILQPRVEAQFSAQDIAARGLGSGLTTVEAGLRLRYEITRQFAPYVEIGWERLLGRTGSVARATGDRFENAYAVVGIRVWY